MSKREGMIRYHLARPFVKKHVLDFIPTGSYLAEYGFQDEVGTRASIGIDRLRSLGNDKEAPQGSLLTNTTGACA